LSEIDQIVNDMIRKNLIVSTKEIPLTSAKQIRGLQAVFGEIYPDPVRVVSIGQTIETLLTNPSNPEWENFSIELCGGTHLSTTSAAVSFAIVSEEALSVGIRRLTAVTGQLALDAIANANALGKILTDAANLSGEALSAVVAEITSQLNTHLLPASQKMEIRESLSKLQTRLREEAKVSKTGQAQSSLIYADSVVQHLKSSPAKFHAGIIDVGFSSVMLTDVAKKIQESFPDVAVLLLSSDQKKGKICIVAQVPQSLIDSKSFKADQWATEVAKAAGGKGGGKPDKAQGVGNDVSKLNNALEVAIAHAKLKLD